MQTVKIAAPILLGVFSLSFACAADLDTETAGRNKVNLSGKQRTLTQKASKAACFAFISPQTASVHIKEMQKAWDEFDQVLLALEDGSAALGLMPETDGRVITALRDVASTSQPLAVAVQQVATEGQVSHERAEQIADANLPVLEKMDATVELIASLYSEAGGIDGRLAKTINTAGYQRTLIQKSAKEYCLALADVSSGDNMQRLRETVDRFDAALTDLRAGANGLLEPEPEAAKDLERIEQIWTALKEKYAVVLQGAEPDVQDIGVVAAQNNRVLREMNRVVYRYTLLTE